MILIYKHLAFKSYLKLNVILFFLLYSSFEIKAQDYQSKVKVGAYYFSGWTGKTNHLTKSLITDYYKRQPKWGWVAGGKETMSKEIEYASNAGIDFFSFCWYYVNSDSTKFKYHPLNSALDSYLTSKNRQKMQFNLLVANHLGAIIRPQDWEVVTNEWIRIFKKQNYLLVEQKPLITFFSLNSLLEEFKTESHIRRALDSFREKAYQAGLSGISIAICVNGEDDEVEKAKLSGFDILTGYNYHHAGFNGKNMELPISNLLVGSENIWQKFIRANRPYIPVVTLNWDSRPWANLDMQSVNSPRYIGYSAGSIYNSITHAISWVSSHPMAVTNERLMMIYAWNEYGEGAWLAPTKAFGNSFLRAVKKAIN